MKLPIYVEHVSDEEAERILEREKKREYSRRSNENLAKRRREALRKKPMCSEGYAGWQCSNRASYTYDGKPVCGTHLRYHQNLELMN